LGQQLVLHGHREAVELGFEFVSEFDDPGHRRSMPIEAYAVKGISCPHFIVGAGLA
jgi:hypothetical protein